MKRNIVSEIYEKPDINVVDIEMDGLILGTSYEQPNTDIDGNPEGSEWD